MLPHHGRNAFCQTSHAPSRLTTAYAAVSSHCVARFIAAAVAPRATASTVTSATATSACASADNRASHAPLRAVWRLASTYEAITALPWPGPSAWKTPYANDRPISIQAAPPSACQARTAPVNCR
ncbi:Uncharacterised protein [Bordetella pertussis]|nr:Uncharacterised protein [Bordetella pertussis]CFO35715.1 Uncharacterised protein [Bordetella pertussis]